MKNYLSPLLYFGNRSKEQEDYYCLILAYREKREQPFDCCYDLFSGSASMSLQAMGLGLAKSYVLNDINPSFAKFWQVVKDSSDELITEYTALYDNYHSKGLSKDYYETIQNQYNENISALTTPAVKHAAHFAFLINHAKDGMPLMAKNSDKDEQRLCCIATDKVEPLASPDVFGETVRQASKLFQENEVTFSCEDFTAYQNQLGQHDLVLLNPPYPDLEDAEEKPEHYVYTRNKNKNELQSHLQEMIAHMDKAQSTFVLFYGVLGLDNAFPLKWSHGHVAHLSGHKDHPFQEYVEHLYLSRNLADILTSDPKKYQHKIQPCIHRIFETQAIHNKDKEALLWKDSSINYEKMNARVNQLARLILEQGLEEDLKSQETLVTIYLNRGPQLIMSIFAVLKTGAAFMPLDTEAGLEGLSVSAAYERFKRSQSRYLITHPSLKEKLTEEALKNNDNLSVNVITVDEEDSWCEKIVERLANKEQSEKNLDRVIMSDSLAYVMYTSGSTGEPKGVEICQRGLPYALMSHQNILNLGRDDCIAQFASIGFDASLMEMFMALGCGGKLHIIDREASKDISLLGKMYKSSSVNVIIQTPRLLEDLKPDDYPDLRAVLIVGEGFDKALATKWIKREGNTNRQIINGYGLTETTICATLEECSEDEPLTIGQTILGLKEKLKPVKRNLFSDVESEVNEIKQELYLTGPSVARGYWQKPELTEERFIKLEDSDGIYYKTGDVVKRLDNGKLVYVGRSDRQIKLRGKRLELGEVEQHIKALCDDVEDVRIVVHGENKSKKLSAYIVPKDKSYCTKHGETVTEKHLKLLREIQAHLLRKIPGYMCPSINNMLLIEALVLKDNVKKSIDDNQMKAKWPVSCIQLPLTQARPDNIDISDMVTLRNICVGILEHDSRSKFGMEHNFYDSAGDSIKVSMFLTNIKKGHYKDEKFKKALQNFTVFDFNQDPTIKGIDRWYGKMSKEQTTQKTKYQELIHETFKMSFSKGLMLAETGIHGQEFYQSKVSLPFYCIHSLLGDALLDYQHSVIRDLPCTYYLLNMPDAFANGQEICWNDWIGDYVKRIRTKDAKGPYWLLGWSSGGFIAEQVAQHLRAGGERVFVFMLDTIHPKLMQDLPLPEHAKLLLKLGKKVIDSIKVCLSLDTLKLALPSQQDLESCSDKQQQVDCLFSTVKKNFQALTLTKSFTHDKDKTERVDKLISSALKIYQAELTLNNVTQEMHEDTQLIKTRKSMEKWEDANLGWSTKQPGQQVKPLSNVDHFTLIQDKDLLEAIKQKLSYQLTQLKLPFYEGVEHLLGKAYKNSIACFDKAISENPNNPAAFVSRGLAKAKLKRYEDAIADYDEAIKLDPKNTGAFFKRGNAKINLKWHEEAIVDFDATIKLDSKYAGAFINRGVAKAALKRYEDAIVDYNDAIKLDPKNTRAFFNRGNAKIELKRYEDAIADYNAAIGLEPKKARAFVNRGFAKAELKRYEDAIADYNAAIELDPKNVLIFFNRGFAKAELKRYEDAIADYDAAIKLGPKNAGMFMGRGCAKAELKRYEDAIVDFNAAIKLDPKNAFAFVNRGNAKAELKRYEDAIADYDTTIKLDSKNARAFFNRGAVKLALKQYEDAIADFNAAIKLDPKNARAFFNRGVAEAELKRYEDAIADFNAAIKLEPKDANAFYNRGSTKAGLKRYEEVIIDYNAAIKLDPKHTSAFNNRGAAKAELKRYEEAIVDFDEAIKLAPEDVSAFFNRGAAKADLKRYKEAIIDYNAAIKLDPKHTNTFINRGVAKAALKQYEDAMIDYNAAIKLDPKDGRAFYNRGNAKAALKQYEDAMTDLNEAIKLDPENAHAFFNRGATKIDLKRYEEAIVDFDEAIKLDPKDADAFFNRGLVKVELKRYEEAIVDFNTAVKLDPKHTNTFINRGVAKAALKRYEEAIVDFNTAIKLDPKDADAFSNRGVAKSKLAAAFNECGKLNLMLQNYQDAVRDFNEAIRLNPENKKASVNLKFAMSQLDSLYKSAHSTFFTKPDSNKVRLNKRKRRNRYPRK
jgi:amino acid adenylation domain-containing protein